MASHAAVARAQEQLLVERLREVAVGDPSFRVLLFGSRASGEPLRDSDFDLVVISDRFRGIPYPQRGARLAAALWATVPLDLICLTPEEFAEKSSGLGVVGVAVRTGRTLI